MNSTKENKVNEIIEDKINNGYDLDLGNIIDSSLETFKKIVWIAGLGYFLVFSLLVIIALVAVNQFVDPDQLKEFTELIQDPTYLENHPNLLLYNFIAIVGIGIIFAPLNAGFLHLCRLAHLNKTLSIGDLFTFYTSRKSIDLIIGTLIVSLISFAISMGLEMANLKLVSFVVSISISLFTFLFIPLIIFADQNFSQALSKSIKIIVKSPFTVLGAMIIGILFALAGLIALCIGILFTISFMYCIQFNIYEKIIGFEEDANNKI